MSDGRLADRIAFPYAVHRLHIAPSGAIIVAVKNPPYGPSRFRVIALQ